MEDSTSVSLSSQIWHSRYCSTERMILEPITKRLTLFRSSRRWPEESDFVAHFCTLCKSENTRTCENCTLSRAIHTRTCENRMLSPQFSHVCVFSDLRNVQKSVTRIIYLGPLPKEQVATLVSVVAFNGCF